ncbi:GPI-anchored cell wall organization protein Ecm33 [Teratosphaeria destructans]|uniref:GPI-anchored cell wall organization protein Ecm33 n=1 Tax=Teratosphaeria destructans TaxID=418781 RepID=A0A9W7W3G3_9PEZI|nr:GPI-anchored cell wall organization protein Ecm33 [Teratosphaeria destructans]
MYRPQEVSAGPPAVQSTPYFPSSPSFRASAVLAGLMRHLSTRTAAIWLCWIWHTLSQVCNNATTTLRGWQDIVALAPCTTFTGSLAIATDFPGPLLEVEGPETILGSVVVANVSNITTIAARNLSTITGDCVLSNLPLLTNLTLPNWSSVSTLRLDRIPTPNTLDLQTTLQQVTNLYVTNTTLEALPALVLPSAQMENLVITGNAYLDTVRFEAGNITQMVTIAGNGGTMDLTLPNLTYAYDMEISNASQIDMPLLHSVSQDLVIHWNSASNISLPQLSFVGSELSITNNSQLLDIRLNQLVNVQGGLDLSGNPQVEQIRGLPVLSVVGGDLTLEGPFTNISLPSLHTVTGDVVIQTSDDEFNCSSIPADIASGSYTCNAQTRLPTSPASRSHGRAHSLSSGAIAGIAVGSIAAVATLALLVFCFWRRRNLPHAPPPSAPPYEPPNHVKYDPPPPPTHISNSWVQQRRSPSPVELPTSRSPPLTPPPLVPERSDRRPRSGNSSQRYPPISLDRFGSGTGSGTGSGGPGVGSPDASPSPVTPLTGLERTGTMSGRSGVSMF